jgi:hypothetical protein
MSNPVENNYKIWIGEDFQANATMKGKDGNSKDITDGTFTYRLSKTPDGPAEFELSIGSGVTMVTPGSGTYKWRLEDTETKTMSPETYHFQGYFTEDGGDTAMVEKGKITVGKRIAGT